MLIFFHLKARVLVKAMPFSSRIAVPLCSSLLPTNEKLVAARSGALDVLRLEAWLASQLVDILLVPHVPFLLGDVGIYVLHNQLFLISQMP